MLKINRDENLNQTNTSKEFNSYFKFIFVIVFLFCVPFTLNFFIDYSTLNSNLFGAALLLFIFSVTLTTLAILIYISPIVFHFIKYKSLKKNEFKAIVNEQRSPTKKSYRIRRVLIWLCSISALATLIAYIIYLMVLIILSL